MVTGQGLAENRAGDGGDPVDDESGARRSIQGRVAATATRSSCRRPRGLGQSGVVAEAAIATWEIGGLGAALAPWVRDAWARWVRQARFTFCYFLLPSPVQ